MFFERGVMGLRPISANLFGMFFFKTPHKIVILRACDFFDLFVFSRAMLLLRMTSSEG